MYQNCELRRALLCFSLLFLFLNYSAHAQVVAGIRANGMIRLHGDTINVCKGSTLIYQSAAQGSLNVSWKFNGGLPAVGSGINPIAVTYNTNGYDTTFQKVVGGAFSDSTFVIVFVSDIHPLASFNFSPDNVCGNENIQFTNNSTTGEPLSYLWSFGDASTHSIQNPSHQFLSAVGLPPATQVFPVKLTVTNIFGCKDSVIHPVTIRKIPDASLGNPDASVSFGIFNGIKTFKKCSNIPFYNFKFQNTSATIPNNVNYTIKWGDGSPDSINFNWGFGQIIGHTFPLGGSRMIVSINGADGCIGIKEYAVFLGTSPSGGLVGPGNTDICSSDSLYFSIANNSSNPNPPGTVYTVLINDGTGPQVFQHPPPASIGHHFELGSCFSTSTAGIQTYTNAFGAYLTIENPCGSTSGSVVPIYVSGKPKPAIHLPTPVVCINTNVTIANASSYGNVISSTGTYTSDCINNGVKVWEIFPATGYTLVAGSLGSLNGSPGDGLLWTDGSNQLNVLFTATGTYTIKIHVFNERCGIASAIRTICVRNPPQASFSLSQQSSCGPFTISPDNNSPTGGCQGDDYDWQVTYSDPSGCAPPADTTFSFVNGTNTASALPSILFKRIGRYAIRLTVRAHNSPYGCPEVHAFDTFYVKGPPIISLSPIAGACINNNVFPAAALLNCYSQGPLGYQWTFANANPATAVTLSPGSIQYSIPGVHPVQLIVTDSSCMLSDTANTNVTIIPLPVAEAGSDASLCTVAALPLGMPPVPGVSYQWSPAAGLSNTAVANPTLTLSYSGPASDTIYIYYLSASLGANCTSMDSVKITVRRKPVVTVSPAAPQICIGTNVSLTASGADSYSWTPSTTLSSSSSNSVTATPLITTTYTVIGTLTNGCIDDETLTVIVHPDSEANFIVADTVKCAPVNIDSLIVNIPYPAGNGTYNWFANGVQIASNATGIVPSYVITQPEDTVTIKLVTLSATGCKPDSVQKTFITRPNVTAAFTKDRDSSCAPLTVLFSNTSSSLTQAQFFWNFGNGITSTSVQPGAITFNTSAAFRDTVYHIILKAYNGCDTTWHRDSVKVFANSKARFAVDTTRGCSPFTISILNTSLGNNYAYYWNFGDGITDTTFSLTAFTHTYYTGAITTYSIQLISENQCTRDTQIINLVVSPNVIQPYITAYGNQLSGCAPHLVTFNNSTIGASQLTWNFGDNTPPVTIPNNQNSISHTYVAAGNYTVIIRLQNDCSDTTIQRSVTVFVPPVADFTASAFRICTGQSLAVTNSSANANSYEWNWGDGTFSQFTSGQHSYNSAGVYDVMLIAKKVHSSGFICTDTITKQVTVVNRIQAHINVTPGKFCAPYTLRVNAGNITGYSQIKWVVYDSSSTQDEFHLTGQEAVHVYNVPGVYSVKLVVHTTAGCADSTIYQFKVYSTPRTSFEPQLIKTCSHDTTVIYSAVTTNNGTDPVNYKWFTNGSIEGTANPFHYTFRAPLNNASPVEFAIRALAENPGGCGDTSLAGKVIIHPLPHPFIDVSPSLVIQQPEYTFTFKDTVATHPNKTYLWSLGDRSLQTREGRQVSYEYSDTGKYKVNLLVTDFSTSCKADDSVRVTIQYIPGFLYVPNAMCVGCSNFGLRQFLPLGKGLKKYRLRIYNAWGQKIFETARLDANGSPSEPWDGVYKQQLLQQDVYTWQIEGTYINDTEWKGMLYPGSAKHVKAGFITIIK